MGTIAVNQPTTSVQSRSVGMERARTFRAYLRRNPTLVVGLILLLGLIAIGVVGPLFVALPRIV